MKFDTYTANGLPAKITDARGFRMPTASMVYRLKRQAFTSLIVGVALLAPPIFSIAAEVHHENNKNVWCYINSNVSLPGNSGAPVKLPKSSIYIAKRALQVEGQGLLQEKAFLALTAADSIRFTSQSAAVPDAEQRLYLVRASAIYDLDSDLESTLVLAASLYPETRTLNLYRFGLRGPETAIQNLALIVKVPGLIEAANAVCETAR